MENPPEDELSLLFKGHHMFEYLFSFATHNIPIMLDKILMMKA